MKQGRGAHRDEGDGSRTKLTRLAQVMVMTAVAALPGRWVGATGTAAEGASAVVMRAPHVGG